MKLDLIEYGTRGKPGDWWKPVVFKIADTSSCSLEVDQAAEDGFVTVNLRLCEAFGIYALTLELGECGRALAAAYASGHNISSASS